MSSPKSATLIDRDELLASLEQDINVSVTGEENMEAVRRCLQEILDDVKESPVVDAVPADMIKGIIKDLRKRLMDIDGDDVDEIWDLRAKIDMLTELLDMWAERKEE
jgi:hypothetical protein